MVLEKKYAIRTGSQHTKLHTADTMMSVSGLLGITIDGRSQPRVFTQADHEATSSNWLVSGVGTCVDSSLCLIVYHGLRELDCSSNSRRPW